MQPILQMCRMHQILRTFSIVDDPYPNFMSPLPAIFVAPPSTSTTLLTTHYSPHRLYHDLRQLPMNSTTLDSVMTDSNVPSLAATLPPPMTDSVVRGSDNHL
ncbi:hypothetical protein SAY87_014544 [Trapa incisa]|uniref:Uncharacterized protein n=1 Tax=Trapa incisa TaxID=236973 RepID=A0AAN7GNF6_9MYRT|nr:hypothetical protein SAY87_014544 [Trapa incisa]